MRLFTSLTELKHFAPTTEQDHIVRCKRGRNRNQVYYWNGYWVEKVYWTVREAAKLIGESEADVLEIVTTKYTHLRKSTENNSCIKLPYKEVIKLKYLIEQTKTVNA